MAEFDAQRLGKQAVLAESKAQAFAMPRGAKGQACNHDLRGPSSRTPWRVIPEQFIPSCLCWVEISALFPAPRSRPWPCSAVAPRSPGLGGCAHRACCNNLSCRTSAVASNRQCIAHIRWEFGYLALHSHPSRSGRFLFIRCGPQQSAILNELRHPPMLHPPPQYLPPQ